MRKKKYYWPKDESLEYKVVYTAREMFWLGMGIGACFMALFATAIFASPIDPTKLSILGQIGVMVGYLSLAMIGFGTIHYFVYKYLPKVVPLRLLLKELNNGLGREKA